MVIALAVCSRPHLHLLLFFYFPTSPPLFFFLVSVCFSLEAMAGEVAAKMNAKNLILTHFAFSDRYNSKDLPGYTDQPYFVLLLFFVGILSLPCSSLIPVSLGDK